MSVVVDTEPNANYEPSDKEIEEYGKWLGMNLPEDKCFLWIAREGLKAPLPEHWKACKSEKGELYYFNFKTGVSIWDHPMDEHFKELLQTEKKNPSAQSIARGAKRSEDESVGVVKKPRKKAILESETAETKGKVLTLNTLKLNKPLPDSLKIDFEGSKASAKSTTKASTYDAGNGPPSGEEIKTGVPESILVSGKLSGREEVIGSGLNGLKALSKINSPGGGKASSSESVKGAAAKPRNTERGEPTQADTAREKEEAQKAMSDELSQFKKQLEAEKEKSIAQYKKEMDQSLIAERRKVDDDFANSVETMRQEYERQREVERTLAEKEFAQKLAEETKAIETRLHDQVSEFREQKAAESAKVRVAQSAALEEAQKCFMDLKAFGASFAQTYEDSYAVFVQGLSRSILDMGLRQQKAEQEKRELDLELRQLREDNRTLVLQEKEKVMNEMEELKRTHLQKMMQLNRLHEEEIAKVKSEHVRSLEEAQSEVRTLQSLCDEKKARAESLREELGAAPKAAEANAASVIADTHEELEKLKQKFVENTRAEIKLLIAELNQEKTSRQQSPSPGNSPGYPLSSSQTSAGNTQSCESTGNAVPTSPTLMPSGNVDWRGESNPGGDESEAVKPGAEMVRRSQSPQGREDMKHVLTDILREIFATSPFIVPSGMEPREREMPSPRSRSTPRAGTRGGLHERLDVVDNERQRLLQAEMFIENQREHLEERRRRLRILRNQWKERVLQAKREGVRSTSQRGRELKAQGVSLEAKSVNLDRELAVLHQSEMWLQKKKQRLAEYESLYGEHRRGFRGATAERESAVNWSIDTGHLMTGFFSPDSEGGEHRAHLHGSSALSPRPADSRSTSPMMATALHRIEERLDKVSTMIDRTNRHISCPRMTSPPERYPATPSNHPQSGRRAHHTRGEYRNVLAPQDGVRGALHMDPSGGILQSSNRPLR